MGEKLSWPNLSNISKVALIERRQLEKTIKNIAALSDNSVGNFSGTCLQTNLLKRMSLLFLEERYIDKWMQLYEALWTVFLYNFVRDIISPRLW